MLALSWGVFLEHNPIPWPPKSNKWALTLVYELFFEQWQKLHCQEMFSPPWVNLWFLVTYWQSGFDSSSTLEDENVVAIEGNVDDWPLELDVGEEDVV